MTKVTTRTHIECFAAAIEAAGMRAPRVIRDDGKLHRFAPTGEPRDTAGWYALQGGRQPHGAFGDWRTGHKENWCAKTPGDMSEAERQAQRERIKAAQRQRKVEDHRRHGEAANTAQARWDKAQQAGDDHPYLVRKGVHAHGLRSEESLLLVPLRDGGDAAVRSIQTIDQMGKKLNMPGGRKQGLYHAIGRPNGVIVVTEGYATAASVFEATGHATICAFGTANLMAVARTLRTNHPEVRLVFAADDDPPGREAAESAARAVGGTVVLPAFRGDKPEDANDFNDLHQCAGLDAVRRCIEEARNPGEPDVEHSQVDEGDEPGGAMPKPGEASVAAPGADVGSECSFGGGRFRLEQRGVFYIAKDGNTGLEKMPQWICGGLAVVAATRDAKSSAWGRLLEWCDADSVRHQWAMPLELLQGDGVDVRRELAQAGLPIAPGRAARELLASYLQVWPVKDRARCVDRLGWQGAVYVTPTESIGESGERVVFQNQHAIEPAYSVAGTADDWRESVARLALGNSRLVFALSVAFAGPLANVAGEDSGGFHIRGGTSIGKSTALKAAASVWGDPVTYPRLWRATANGLEGLAALHNDGLLILDELSQIDPKEAGEAAYLLANGQGKTRAARNGTARQAASWRLLFLSAGEESLSALMARIGRKVNAGQEIRLADIEADAGAGLGVFETLNGCASPAALSLALKDAATRHHGAAGISWLRAIVNDRDKLADLITGGVRQFVAENAPTVAAGQVLRVAQRFGLVAVAGELATHYGVTGWPEGEATQAASQCFVAWLDSFGGQGNREDRALLAQVRGFFETHGASRFEDVAATVDQRIINRAGFYRTGPDGAREFLVLPEAFRRDVCAGFDLKAATRCLLAHGWIVAGGDARPTQKPRLPGIGTTRVYVFTNKWADAE